MGRLACLRRLRSPADERGAAVNAGPLILACLAGAVLIGVAMLITDHYVKLARVV